MLVYIELSGNMIDRQRETAPCPECLDVEDADEDVCSLITDSWAPYGLETYCCADILLTA